MKLLNPLALILGAAAIPIIILYMLKLRRQEIKISSVYLWQLVLKDYQANSPWQRLKRNLLLLLQLLILAAVVMALTRPVIPIPGIKANALIVLLDASASMQATDLTPSRFETARSEIKTIISVMGSGERMTLILVQEQPLILASNQADKTALNQALESASASNSTANWEAAFALAAGVATQAQAVPEARAEASTILIVSDGGLPKTELPPLPGIVRFLPIGQQGDNLSISALSLGSSGGQGQLYTRLTNYGSEPREVLFSLYRDEALIHAQEISLPPGEAASLLLDDLSLEQAIYRAQLSPPAGVQEPGDFLELDNTAISTYQTEQPGRVLLVSRGNIFLEQALSALTGITPFRVLPAENGDILLPEDPFDLYIFDGILPSDGSLPSGNLLFVNPPNNPLFTVNGAFTQTQDATLIDSPLTQFVDWENIHIAQAKNIELPDWAQTLIQVDAGPLLFSGETQGRRVAALAFDLHDSDLPLQTSFPILMANLLDYLVPRRAFEAVNGLQPGDSLLISPPPDVTEVIIHSPQGQVYSYPQAGDPLLFTRTDELGVYTVDYVSNLQADSDYFTVNLFDDSESDIRPVRNIQIGSVVIPTLAGETGEFELWPWLTLSALVLLMLEWWIFHRQRTIRPSWRTIIRTLSPKLKLRRLTPGNIRAPR